MYIISASRTLFDTKMIAPKLKAVYLLSNARTIGEAYVSSVKGSRFSGLVRPANRSAFAVGDLSRATYVLTLNGYSVDFS